MSKTTKRGEKAHIVRIPAKPKQREGAWLIRAAHGDILPVKVELGDDETAERLIQFTELPEVQIEPVDVKGGGRGQVAWILFDQNHLAETLFDAKPHERLYGDVLFWGVLPREFEKHVHRDAPPGLEDIIDEEE